MLGTVPTRERVGVGGGAAEVVVDLRSTRLQLSDSHTEDDAMRFFLFFSPPPSAQHRLNVKT